MRLLSCIVAHNRVELTRRCVESYLATVTVPFQLIVVDNASTDGTRDWLLDELVKRDPVALGEVTVTSRRTNDFPGAACNHGWAELIDCQEGYFGVPKATLLHRSDNDIEYLPGWCDELARVLADQNVGQVGLLEERYDQGCFNVGGTCVIRRELWDAGVRWEPMRWEQPEGAGPLATEDTVMSADVTRHGFRIARVGREVVIHHGWDWEQYPDYYERSAAARGYDSGWLRGHFDRMRAL